MFSGLYVLRPMVLPAIGSAATGSSATGSAAVNSRPIGQPTLSPVPSLFLFLHRNQSIHSKIFRFSELGNSGNGKKGMYAKFHLFSRQSERIREAEVNFLGCSIV